MFSLNFADAANDLTRESATAISTTTVPVRADRQRRPRPVLRADPDPCRNRRAWKTQRFQTSMANLFRSTSTPPINHHSGRLAL